MNRISTQIDNRIQNNLRKLNNSTINTLGINNGSVVNLSFNVPVHPPHCGNPITIQPYPLPGYPVDSNNIGLGANTTGPVDIYANPVQTPTQFPGAPSFPGMNPNAPTNTIQISSNPNQPTQGTAMFRVKF
jgi:hypothetical protein